MEWKLPGDEMDEVGLPCLLAKPRPNPDVEIHADDVVAEDLTAQASSTQEGSGSVRVLRRSF